MGASGRGLYRAQAKARKFPATAPDEPIPDRNGGLLWVLSKAKFTNVANTMPRYFFHVREGSSFHRDEEGQELPDAEAARQEAVNTSREMLGEKLLHGGPAS